MDYQITVQGEQKGPYSLSQLQSMWESGTITSDSLYWNTEAEEWKTIKELVEPSPPQVLDEHTERDEESWHEHHIAPPVLDEPATSRDWPRVIVVLIVAGLVIWFLWEVLAFEKSNRDFERKFHRLPTSTLEQAWREA